jgi:hypothetical protein
MPNFVLILSLLLFFAEAKAFNFDTDGLCFKNGSEELKKFGPLGQLGHKKGICQGMSGVVSAFLEHATFKPGKNKLGSTEAYWAVNDILRLHSGGCRTKKKIVISGHASLSDFCRAHKDLLMEKAIDYNADIAVREISWKMDQFLLFEDSPIQSHNSRLKLHKNVLSLKSRLNEGRYPLMLYYRHVVMIHSVRHLYTEGKLSKVVLGIYDSNYYRSTEYVIDYSRDALPKSGQKMIWDITPSRLTTPCW